MSTERSDGRPADAAARVHARVAEWDAAYVLGALDPDDRHTYEAHLAECGRCRDAVAELAGMPGLLARVPASEALVEPEFGQLQEQGLGAVVSGPGTAPAEVVDLAAVAERIRGNRARRRWTAAAVAAALLVVGGGGGWALASSVGSATVTATPTSHAGTPVTLASVGGSGVTADLTIESVAWGTRLSWSCRYPGAATSGAVAGPYPGSYALVVVDRQGNATTVATWNASGTGAEGLKAATDVVASDLARVEIRTGGGALVAGGDV